MADQSDPRSLAARFRDGCLLILAGVVALTIAFDLLARIWGWIVLTFLLLAVAWGGLRVWRSRRNRW